MFNKQILLNYGEKTGLALSVFIGALIIGWIVSFIIKQIGKHKSIQSNRVYKLMAGSINTGIVILGLISALGTLGVNINAMVAGLGLTGFAVGIALKDAVSNLVAGLLIVMYKPFDIGELITVTGVTGKVKDINLRYVTVEGENEEVMIPNNNFMTNIIKRDKVKPVIKK